MLGTLKAKAAGFEIRRNRVLSYSIALAILQPILVLTWSSFFGRLAFSLGYDDVNYAGDILTRLNILQASGFRDFFVNLIEDPPHSPLSFVFGIIGMPFFGVGDFGFYSGNMIAFWTIAYLGYNLLGKLLPWATSPRALWLVLFSISPIGISMVSDSRPDVFYGVITAIATLYIWRLLEGKDLISSWGVAALICLGIASKPTAFIHSVFIICVVFFFLTIKSKGFSRISFLRLWSLTWRTLLVSTPLIIVEFVPISTYVLETVFGSQQNIWQFDEENSFFDLFLIFVQPSWQRFGGLVTPFALGMFAWALIRRRQAFPSETIFLLLVGSASFVLVVSQGIKNEFFFIFFHACLLIAVSILFPHFIQDLPSGRFSRLIPVIAVVAGGVLITGSLLCIAVPGYPENKKGSGEMQKLISVLTDRKDLRVFLPTVGAISSENLYWEAGVRGFALDTGPLEIKGAALFSTTKESLDISKDFETIIFPNLITANYFEWLPSTTILPNLIETYIQDGYKPIAYDGASSSRYYVLVKGQENSKIPIHVSNKHLGPKVIFQHSLKTYEVREILGSSATLCWNIFTAGKYDLRIKTLEQANLSVAGDATSNWAAVQGINGQTTVFSATLPAGRQCLTFTISKTTSGPVHLMAGFDDANLKLAP